MDGVLANILSLDSFFDNVMSNSMKIMGIAFSGIAIITLIITIIFSLSTATEIGGKKAIIYDKKIISALQDVSNKVPAGEGIISPNFIPIVMYFSERIAYTPYSANSYASLLNVMDNKSFTYLLVFENQSDVEGLKQIFKKNELPNLSNEFSEIATYNTDFSKLHLYRRN